VFLNSLFGWVVHGAQKHESCTLESEGGGSQVIWKVRGARDRDSQDSRGIHLNSRVLTFCINTTESCKLRRIIFLVRSGIPECC